MSDISYATIQRPLTMSMVKDYIKRAEEAEEEISAEDVRALLAVKVACRSVTRREAHVRGDLREATFAWIEKEAGKSRVDIEVAELPTDLGDEFVCRMQASDIIAALVWDECVGFEFGLAVPAWLDGEHFWQATKDPADWGECKDWLFSRALGLAWETNPQWALASGNVPFG